MWRELESPLDQPQRYKASWVTLYFKHSLHYLNEIKVRLHFIGDMKEKMLNLLIMKEIRDELGKAGHYNGIEPAYLNIEYDFVKVVYAVGDEIKGLGTKAII